MGITEAWQELWWTPSTLSGSPPHAPVTPYSFHMCCIQPRQPSARREKARVKRMWEHDDSKGCGLLPSQFCVCVIRAGDARPETHKCSVNHLTASWTKDALTKTYLIWMTRIGWISGMHVFKQLVPAQNRFVLFKIFHRAYFTSRRLHRLNLNLSPTCWRCGHLDRDFNIFWTCCLISQF